MPKEHVPSIHVTVAAQKGVLALVPDADDCAAGSCHRMASRIRGWADGGESVPHTVIHVVTRRTSDRVGLPECSEWIDDDGVLA